MHCVGVLVKFPNTWIVYQKKLEQNQPIILLCGGYHQRLEVQEYQISNSTSFPTPSLYQPALAPLIIIKK
jgi:hypothetical protein